VYVFTQTVFDAAYPDFPALDDAVAVTTTRANGRWTDALRVNPGQYVILFEKPGEYGPDTAAVTVTPGSSVPNTLPMTAAPNTPPVSQATQTKNDFWDV
jgi:hypothetical protein